MKNMSFEMHGSTYSGFCLVVDFMLLRGLQLVESAWKNCGCCGQGAVEDTEQGL